MLGFSTMGLFLWYILIVILESRITAPVSVIFIHLISYIFELCFYDVLVRIVIDCRLGTFCGAYP